MNYKSILQYVFRIPHLLIALLLLNLDGFAQRVEPICWWVGMNNPELQIMIHDENIHDADVRLLNADGVALTAVNRGDSENYLFIDLLIAELAPAQTFKIELIRKGKKVASYDYELKAREKSSADFKGFGKDDVIYLITPDRFANADESNDNHAELIEKSNRSSWGGRHGGDIKGIEQHLDYIEEMGFTAIWLNPLLENDMNDHSYHGYATTDYYRTDARYGSNEEYKQLVEAARIKGIKVIMDVIVNHCGSNHWWMNDLPFSDWINNGGEFMQTSHIHQVVQDVHASNYDRKMFNDGWFVSVMPDLNQRNTFLSTYLIQNNIWWIEYLGLAGIRQDTYPYSDPRFMTDWSCAIMNEYPNMNIVGEEWVNNPAITSYWQAGKQNNNGYTSCLPSLMDFPVQEALVKALTSDPENKDTWGSKFKILYEMLANDFQYPDPFGLVTFPDNHDMSRFYSQIGQDIDLYKIGIAFILTTRGIPQIYYGTEILAADSTGDHGEIRFDFPGGWENDAVSVFENKGLNASQQEALLFMKNILSWRKTANAVHHGKLMHFVPENDNQIYTYIRYDENGNKVLVALNRSHEAYRLNLGKYQEIIPMSFSAKEIISNKTLEIKNSFEIPARKAIILEILK
ncbi:MAG: glycoside hydrolase family 13 protein [Mangrovibacterium sp.]